MPALDDIGEDVTSSAVGKSRLLSSFSFMGRLGVADNKLGSWHSEVEECLETILEGQGNP